MDAGLLTKIANWLLIIGGINWGLVGLADTDLVAELFGVDSTLSNIIYILVGLAAVWVLVAMFRPAPTHSRRDDV